MSDNLKVAKECGAVETGKYTIELRVSQLEAYTSRRLASQQAAHEAEIARLKEEMAECEQRGAVKALEDAASKCQNGYDAAIVAAMADKLQ